MITDLHITDIPKGQLSTVLSLVDDASWPKVSIKLWENGSSDSIYYNGIDYVYGEMTSSNEFISYIQLIRKYANNRIP